MPAPNRDEWADAYLHRPLILEGRVDVDDAVMIGGCSCGAAEPGPDQVGRVVFAEHLRAAGAPDYLLGYWEFWSALVEPDGGLDRDLVARELFDYRVVMGEASQVYEHLAGLSKPNTAARHVLARADEKYASTYADYLCDEANNLDVDDRARALLHEIAEEWHPGAVAEYAQHAADRDAYLGRATTGSPATDSPAGPSTKDA